MRFHGSKALILFTRRLMPSELRLQSDRGTQKSEIYFTNHTLTGKRALTGKRPLFRCCIRTLSGDSTVRDVRNGLVRTVPVRLYFTNHTLTGKLAAFPWLGLDTARRFRGPRCQ